jgi:hypothetical protein
MSSSSAASFVFVGVLGTSFIVSGCTGVIEDPGSASDRHTGVGTDPGAQGSATRPPEGMAPAMTVGAPGSPSGAASTAGMADPSEFTSADGLWDARGGFACSTDRDGIRSAFRQLTRLQYRNTIRDLLGIETDMGDGITSDERSGFFASNSVSAIQQIEVEKYGFAAASLAKQAVGEKLEALLPCNPTAADTASCARQFIAKFGLRAFRRPLSEEEVDRYLSDLFTPAAKAGAFSDGVQMVIEAMLQSPFFVYHLELGAGTGQSTGPAPLDDYELAARLSYFFWASMPDEQLFAAAAAGRLANGADLGVQVERLIKDSRARHVVRDYFSQWLEIEDLFAGDGGAPADSLLAFIDNLWDASGGNLDELLGSTTSFVNQQLGPVFGVTVTGPALRPVKMTDGQRVGLLTQPGVLQVHSGETTWPIFRGILVRERLLCQVVLPPGQEVPEVVVGAKGPESVRQALSRHAADPGCAACHQNFDPIGFAFGHFDPLGRYRTTEAGKPVDASGELKHTADIDGPINGTGDLMRKLASSEEVRACLTRATFRFAIGRSEIRADGCALGRLHSAYKASGGSMRELMKAIATSKEFRTNLR